MMSTNQKIIAVIKSKRNINILLKALLVILVFLAVSSGVTKIILLPQDVEFFGKYGFTNSILIAYGIVQVLAGILLVLPKTRVIGAIILAITFLISAVILVMEDNIPVAIVTLIFVLLLGLIVRLSLNKAIQQPTKT